MTHSRPPQGKQGKRVLSHEIYQRTMRASSALTFAAAAAVMAPHAARADVLVSDFEDLQLQPAWGALTNSGVKDWSDPAAAPNAAAGTIINAPSGPLAGSNVL